MNELKTLKELGRTYTDSWFENGKEKSAKFTMLEKEELRKEIIKRVKFYRKKGLSLLSHEFMIFGDLTEEDIK